MYIEMTTFAIPTFLVEGIKFALLVAAIWFVVGIVGITVYWFTAGPKK
jgi:hypothetical protein